MAPGKQLQAPAVSAYRRSSRSAPVSSAPNTPAHAQQADDEQQDHGADEGDEHRAQDRVPRDGNAPVEHAREKAAEKRAHDPYEHIAQHAQTMSEREMAGKKSSYKTDDDPEKKSVEVEDQFFRPPCPKNA